MSTDAIVPDFVHNAYRRRHEDKPKLCDVRGAITSRGGTGATRYHGTKRRAIISIVIVFLVQEMEFSHDRCAIEFFLGLLRNALLTDRVNLHTLD
jgi:hypothetical protein